ncbi:hypothetical protein [Poritiphilus flavus]|uniref:Uncharacterized protein n=1 Tax=Poritiphilus flavus TaxID=2697053 RepID=A0A6L9E7Y3_9FLAO|nr:hypothetical protein [Poritiphilus flavus]NAS10722.1 hypothetical protein [Poritiphilus flavus]
MKTTLEKYETRRIAFRESRQISGWGVKLYTITKRDSFQSELTYSSFLAALPELLKQAGNSDLPTHKQAFVIVHEAREGVLILLNWWTGGEMVETEIYFSDYDNPATILPSPFADKALVCIWEIEVFAHERKAWITHVLSRPENPDFQSYLEDAKILQ